MERHECPLDCLCFTCASTYVVHNNHKNTTKQTFCEKQLPIIDFTPLQDREGKWKETDGNNACPNSVT